MRIKLHKLFIGCAIITGWASYAQNNQFLTVTSGYNADVIANGVGSAESSTSISVDNANYAFMSRDFQISATSPTYAYAIPANGTLTVAANSNIQFQFAPFTGNNSLRLPETGNTGTLEFSNQVMARRLYVVATGGSGAVTISTVVHFDDGTNQSATGTVVPDWYNNNSLPIVISGIGRVSRNDNGIQNETGNPRLYMFTINLTALNQAKRVTGIEFTKTSAAEGVLNVFAVTADAVPCTAPIPPVATAQTYCGTTTASQLTATATLTGGTFRWYTTATGGTALAPTATVSSGIYFVAQADGSCESTRVPVEVTVNITPQPEGAAQQTICIGGTLSNVQAPAIEGATVAFTHNGVAVVAGVPLESGVYQVIQTIEGCASEPKDITVTVGVSEPVASANQILCMSSATVADIEVTAIEGATVNYFLVGFILQPVAPTDSLISGRYSITQTLNGCTSEASYVDVEVSEPPVQLVGEETQEFTAGEMANTLEFEVYTDVIVNWYILNSAMEYVSIDPATTPLTNGTTYYIAQFNGTCESPYLAVTVSEVMKRANASVNDILIYPNPAATVLNVTGKQVITNIAVSNILGQKVINQTANAAHVQVNVTLLSAGTYFLQVYTPVSTQTIKFVKQ